MEVGGGEGERAGQAGAGVGGDDGDGSGIGLHASGDVVGHFVADARLRRNMPLIILASVAMMGGLLFTSYLLSPYLGADARFLEKTAALAIEIGVGVAIFGAFILAFGVMSFRQLGSFIGRGSKA